jgi:prepilin-type N-terminal cleavage/methylation domain-containing protein
MIITPHSRVRAGFSIAEITVALAILGIMMVVVAQTGYWSMQQRLENIAKQLALEHANNILEAARTMPFEKLNEQWAADIELPENKSLLPEGQIAIQVEPEKGLPRTKRVTVEVTWARDRGLPEQLVRLVALFASRTEVKK